MVKLFFIILGIVCLFYGFLSFLLQKKLKNNNRHVSKVVEAFECPYCDEYIGEEPKILHGICQLCKKEMVTTLKN